MPSVELESRDRIAYVTLNRPKAMNAIDESVLEELPKAIAAIDGEKACVITGAGDAFCVGLDIELLGKAFSDTTYFRSVLERFKQILLDIEALGTPVVAAVNGLTRAGGFELMLACDLVIAAEDARVGDNHLSFGILPGGGSSQRLPRKIGPQKASELIFTGRWLNGREAADYGLALRAVPGAELAEAVEDLVDNLRPLSAPALSAAKRLIREGAGKTLREGLDLEIEQFVDYLRNEPTASEGYRAFVEGRKPSWD